GVGSRKRRLYIDTRVHALRKFVGITFWNDVFTHTCLVTKLDGQAIQCAVDDGKADFYEVGVQQRGDVHNFRVAEARIVFDYTQAAAREHKSAVKNTFVFFAGFLQQRFANATIDVFSSLQFLGSQKWQEMVGAGVRAHSTSVWSCIVFIGALVVLDRHHVCDMPSVKERLQSTLFAIQFFFARQRAPLSK